MPLLLVRQSDQQPTSQPSSQPHTGCMYDVATAAVVGRAFVRSPRRRLRPCCTPALMNHLAAPAFGFLCFDGSGEVNGKCRGPVAVTQSDAAGRVGSSCAHHDSIARNGQRRRVFVESRIVCGGQTRRARAASGNRLGGSIGRSIKTQRHRFIVWIRVLFDQHAWCRMPRCCLLGLAHYHIYVHARMIDS